MSAPPVTKAAGRAPLDHLILVLGAALGMASGFAVLFGGTFGLFVKPISADFAWDRSSVSLILTMGFLGYSLGSPIAGMLYDRLGIARVQGAAIAVFGAALASFAWLPPVLPLFMAGGLVVGLSGAATAPSGYVLILVKTIRDRLGLAVGIAMVGLGAGLSFAPALARSSIDLWGWSRAYLALGVAAIVGGYLALALIGFARSRIQPALPVATAGEPSLDGSEGLTLRQALADWRFWILGATALVISAVGFGTLAHLPAALSDRGMPDGDVVRVAGTMGLGIFAGRVSAALAMDRFFAPAIALTCYVVGAAGLYGLATLPTDGLAMLQLGAVAAGFLTGSEGDVMPFLTRHYFGLARFGAIFGCVLGLAGFGGLIGPILFARVFEATGSYGPAFTAGVVACLLSGVALMAMGPYRYLVRRKRAAKEDFAPARVRTAG